MFSRTLPAHGNWIYAAVLSVAGLVAAGCMHYQPAPLAPERSAEQFSTRSLADPPIRDAVVRLLPQTAAAWPPQQWDRAQLLAVALVQNPNLAVAQAQFRATLAHETTAAQTPNPDLTLESEYAVHDQHPWLYGLGLSWLLRSPERRRLDIEVAQRETGSARLLTMEQVWSIRRALVAALSDGESARRSRDLLDRLAAAQDRLIAIEQQRVNAGEDPPSELVTSQQLRIEIEQHQAEVRAHGDSAQAALAKALGLPPQALDGLTYAWSDWGVPPSLDEETLRRSRELALLSRADLAAAISDYAVAEAKLKQAVARQYPQFELQPGYYWDHGIAKWPFDVGFTLPLNGNKGEIAEARAARDLAGQRMLALQADIFGEIASAERAERIARDGADVADRRLTAARLQLQHADLALRLGEAPLHEQIDAKIIATRAELELLEMRARLQATRNSLEDALHAPLSGPELSLSRAMTSSAFRAGS
jgi:cobalt-zinc-cadmium efflux system outer membrane protein